MSQTPTKFYGYGSGALTAQCFATFVVSLTYIGNGIMNTVPTIVLGNVLNSKYDTLSLTEEEASWFGGIPLLLQPVGNFIGILLLDFCSHRYGLLLSNTFGLVFLLTLYNANEASTALLSSIVVGLGIGFTAPSGMSYISEYTEPKFRGLLSFGTSLMQNIGVLFFCYVASMVYWRTLLLLGIIIPLTSVLLLTRIPNSPVWLLSKGRKEEALKALCWFRGWVSEEDVQEEFDDLENYVKTSLTYSEQTADAEETSLLGKSNGGKFGNLSELLSSILERRTLYPLMFMIVFNLIICIAEAVGASMYAMNFFDALHLSFDSYFLMFIAFFSRTVGNIIFIVVLKYTGKRSVALLAVFILASTSIGTGVYIHYKDQLQMAGIFIVLLFVRGFGASQAEVPALMAGEMFPVRFEETVEVSVVELRDHASRGSTACARRAVYRILKINMGEASEREIISQTNNLHLGGDFFRISGTSLSEKGEQWTRHAGSGLNGTISSILQFFFVKTYFVTIHILGLELYFLVCGFVGMIGCLYLYICLPETEGKSLFELEDIFLKTSDTTRKQ